MMCCVLKGLMYDYVAQLIVAPGREQACVSEYDLSFLTCVPAEVEETAGSTRATRIGADAPDGADEWIFTRSQVVLIGLDGTER